MSTTWDFDTPQGGGNKQEFTKFPEGITRIRIIDEAPVVRWTHYLPKFKRSINCPGIGCPICEIRHQQKANKEPYTYAMARRFAMQVINRETGKLEILEQGKTFFEDLKELKEQIESKRLTLSDVDVRVKRKGTGQTDTSYRLDIDVETPLTEADKKLIEGKINLEDYFKPHDADKILRIVNGEEWNDVMGAANTEDEGINIK